MIVEHQDREKLGQADGHTGAIGGCVDRVLGLAEACQATEA